MKCQDKTTWWSKSLKVDSGSVIFDVDGLHSKKGGTVLESNGKEPVVLVHESALEDFVAAKKRSGDCQTFPKQRRNNAMDIANLVKQMPISVQAPCLGSNERPTRLSDLLTVFMSTSVGIIWLQSRLGSQWGLHLAGLCVEMPKKQGRF